METLALEAARTAPVLAPVVSAIIGTLLLIATLGSIDRAG
jgi:hypothetical protein